MLFMSDKFYKSLKTRKYGGSLSRVMVVIIIIVLNSKYIFFFNINRYYSHRNINNTSHHTNLTHI